MESPNFNSSQSACHRHHSTETALTRQLNDIYGNFDKGLSTLLITLDLLAAFDTVQHSLLLTRLEDSFGIHGSILEFIKSYLIDRSQFVRFGSASAAIANCTCGVPQGSECVCLRGGVG
jgi:Reverse transcriptase (RNA-dependent DNA polymerase)